MGLQRKYGYVAIDTPSFEQDGWLDPIDQITYQTMGSPEGTPWSGTAYGERSYSHIRLLMIVVLFLSASAFWIVLRPNAAVSASDRQSLPADGGYSAFNSAGSSDENTASLMSQESGETDALVGSDSPVAAVGKLSSLFTREVLHWKPQILRWAAEYEVDPNIVATIMQIESCGNPGAASYAGAQGLFQVMPFHFQPGENMLDPDTNAMRGLAFYREQMRYTSDDVFLSFAGYNGGYAASGGAYENWAAETQRYYYWAKGIYLDASSGAKQSTRLSEWLVAGGAGGCQSAAAVLGI
jgi:soluble lytic murein transglycosylase-like protein